MDSATDNDHSPPPDWDRDDDRALDAGLNTEDVAPRTETRKPVAGKTSQWRPVKTSNATAR